MTPAASDALRERLLALRADALAQLCDGLPVVDTGMLRLVADASGVTPTLGSQPGLRSDR